MRFSANRITLLEALTVTGKVIGKGILPIMSSYLFKINDGKIEITGGSMDVYVKNTIEIPSCGLSVTIAIPKDKLYDLIKDSPNQLIDFEVFENEDLEEDKVITCVRVTTSIGKYVIPIEMGQDYPFMKIENPHVFSVAHSDLLKGISKSLFACGDDILRPEFTGVYICCDKDNQLTFTSTNANIVATTTLVSETLFPLKNGFLVPQKVLTVLQSLPSEDIVEVMLTDRHVKFKLSDELTIESILINEQFPNYLYVIPTDQPNHIKIRKSQLLGSVKRVSRFSDIELSQILISFSTESCRVSCSNTFGKNAAEEEFIIDYSGQPMNIGLSGKLLMSCLNNIDTDLVTISFSDPKMPFTMRDTNEDTKINTKQNLILLMPMYKNN